MGTTNLNLLNWQHCSCCGWSWRMYVPHLKTKNVSLISDHSPAVEWVTQLVPSKSHIAQLVRALAVCLRLHQTYLHTLLHIISKEYSNSGILFHLFQIKSWKYCKNEHNLQIFFIAIFPLPNQISWTILQHSSSIIHLKFQYCRCNIKCWTSSRDYWNPGDTFMVLVPVCQTCSVDTWLQNVTNFVKIWLIIKFTAVIRVGQSTAVCKKQQISTATVPAAIGHKITMALWYNSLKPVGSQKFLPQVHQTLDGMHKANPLPMNKLPTTRGEKCARADGKNWVGGHCISYLQQVVRYLALVVVYYLFGVTKWIQSNIDF